MKGGPEKGLSLFDSTCIIVGIIIGAGIYETAPMVAKCLRSGPGVLGIWLAGGLLALTEALCYAELATTYPQEGGDYVYLTRAYGQWAGYMFGWSQLAVVRPGDIALMAFIFARYAQTHYAPFADSRLFYASGAIVVLTAINILGVKAGKWTQNLLTVAKILGLVAISVAGLAASEPAPMLSQPEAFTWGGLELALILVLFTFGGWNEMAYVAAEIKQPHRNIVRGLVIGTLAVTALYLLINGAFLSALGLVPMSTSQAVAVDLLGRVFPQAATRVIAILICISALGAVVLGGSASGNVYSSLGAGREIKLLLADELAFILVLLVRIIKSGYQLDLGNILAAQSDGMFIGSASGIIAFIIGLLCIQAKMTLPPFHIPEAETEIVEGPFMEYSGPPLGFWKLNHFMMYVVFPFLLVLLFWGGFNFSGIGILWSVLEYLLIVVLMIIIKNTNPRIRIDTALNFFWKYVTPLVLIAIVLAVFGY